MASYLAHFAPFFPAFVLGVAGAVIGWRGMCRSYRRLLQYRFERFAGVNKLMLLFLLLCAPAWAQHDSEGFPPEPPQAHLVGSVKAAGLPGPMPVGAVPRSVGRPSKPHPVVKCQGEPGPVVLGVTLAQEVGK